MNATLTPTHEKLGLTEEILTGLDIALSRRDMELEAAIANGADRECLADEFAKLRAAQGWYATVNHQIHLDEIRMEEESR